MKPQSITSLPDSPRADRDKRMRNYSIAMAVRMICIASCFFLQGWWIAVAIVAAAIIPNVAVMIANNTDNRAGNVTSPRQLCPGGSSRPIEEEGQS